MPSINIELPTCDNIKGLTVNDSHRAIIRGKKDKEVYGGKWDKNNGKPPDDRFYHVSYDKGGNCTEFYFKNERYFIKMHKGYLGCLIKNFYKEDEDGNIECISPNETNHSEFSYILNNYNTIYFHYVLTEEDIYGKKD